MDVAVIEYHSGDEYQNNYGTTRISYYGITGFPTVKFDGILSSVGGGGNLYPTYLGKYNQRMNVMSDYTISTTGSNAGMLDYEVVITVEKVASGSIDNPKLHVAVTETDIPEFWGGLSEVNWVERLMIPNQNGTSLDFSGTTTEEVTLSFSLDPSWINEKCAIVVFVQNQSTKEIYQGAEFNLVEFPTTNTLDAALVSATAPNTVCLDGFVPKVEIANFGLDNLTSLDINYEVNGGTPMTHSWTGDLAFLETAMVELSEITFAIQANNILSITCENPNGSNDQYPSNNDISTTFEEAEQVENSCGLQILFGENPEEISWELLDSQNNILYSGDNYSSNPPMIVEYFDLPTSGCYSFSIYDDAGNGLNGGGVYKLFYNQNIVFQQNNDFGYMEETQFSIDVTGVAEEIKTDDFSVFPNPVVNTANISFVMESSDEVSLKVYDLMGKIVKQTDAQVYSAGNQSMTFHKENMNSGIYFFSLEMGETQITQRVIIK